MPCIIRVPSNPEALPRRLREDFPTFLETYIDTIQEVLEQRFPRQDIKVLQGGRSPLNINGVTDLSYMEQQEVDIITYLTYDDTWHRITTKVIHRLHRTVEDTDVLPKEEGDTETDEEEELA